MWRLLVHINNVSGKTKSTSSLSKNASLQINMIVEDIDTLLFDTYIGLSE